MPSTAPRQNLRRQLELYVYVHRERQVFSLPSAGTVSVGRSHDNDIRIDHRSVSRRHIRIHLGPDTLEVEDVGSSNGTFFLGERDEIAGEEMTDGRDQQVQPGVRATLRVGELLRIGSVLMLIHRKSPSTHHEALRPSVTRFAPAVLNDPVVRKVHELGARAAKSNITVLILGETGVGKEVLAETIHQHSARAKQPMLRLNCAALSESLLESELFGHERGAFTGAVSAKAGLLEATSGGTVFLDEIGELPRSIQVKLLRVFEEGAVRRVGSARSRKIDVRFITATNRILEEEVARGRFREDLYFRINKVTLVLPPLRERRGEIEPLARFFLHEFCRTSGIPEPRLTPEALEAMLEYAWPGNVRELRNVMERAPFLAVDGVVLPEHVPQPTKLVRSPVAALLDEADYDDATDMHELLEPPTIVDRPLTERERVIQALEACGGNQTRAAKLLGISRRTLVNRLDDFGLPRPKKRVQ